MGRAKLARKSLPFQVQVVGDATFTVGAESSNVVNFACQLKDENGKALTQRVNVRAYFADAPTGAAIQATAASSTVAIGTNGAIVAELVTKKAWLITTNATGQFDINATEAGAKTAYLVVVLPDGTLKVSGVGTWA